MPYKPRGVTLALDMAVFSDGRIEFKSLGPSKPKPFGERLGDLEVDEIPRWWTACWSWTAGETPEAFRRRSLGIRFRGDGRQARLQFSGILPPARPLLRTKIVRAAERAPHHVGPAVMGANMAYGATRLRGARDQAAQVAQLWREMISQGTVVGVRPMARTLQPHFAWIPETEWLATEP
jgi:hypothetical protein